MATGRPRPRASLAGRGGHPARRNLSVKAITPISDTLPAATQGPVGYGAGTRPTPTSAAIYI